MLKYQSPFTCARIINKSAVNAIKSINSVTNRSGNALPNLILDGISYFVAYIGKNTTISSNKIDAAATKNQFPPEYIAHTLNNNSNAASIADGIKIGLRFFISDGRLVKVKPSVKAAKTIKNQSSVPRVARLHIKHVGNAIP